MTIQDLGNVGELVAAIATVATLGYLALQIRQNTDNLRINAYNQKSSALGDLLAAVYADAELSEIFRRGSADLASLSQEEQARYSAYMAAFFYNYENLFSLFEKGAIDPEMWENALGNALPLFSRPGVRHYGDRRVGAASRRFWAYVSELDPPE